MCFIHVLHVLYMPMEVGLLGLVIFQPRVIKDAALVNLWAVLISLEVSKRTNSEIATYNSQHSHPLWHDTLVKPMYIYGAYIGRLHVFIRAFLIFQHRALFVHVIQVLKIQRS